MHECVTTSTYSMRAKPEGCMYLWLRTSALYSYSPAWGVLTGCTQVQGECRQCVVISATTGQYHDIALATGQYRICCPGGSFDLRHRWATM